MIDFSLCISTKMIFGKGVHTQVGDVIKGYGFQKVLLVYGGQSIVKCGLYDTVVQKLRDAGIDFVPIGGVQPNPTVAFCRKVAALAKRENVQMFLAVGGGSVIDTCKCAAHAVANDADVADILYGKVPVQKTIPVGVVLTISAAGSETSDSLVMTDEERGLKRGLGHQLNRPLFAIMDPTMTYTVSPYQTASGVTDIMMHTMERYIHLDEGDHDLVDRVSEGLLKAVISAGRKALADPQDYDARATLMLAGSWSHNGLTGAGCKVNMVAHKLEHEMGALDPKIAHGAGLAVVWPAYLDYIYKGDIPRFAQYAERIWDVAPGEPEAMAREGICRTRAYFNEIGMPATLRDCGLSKTDIEAMADKATNDGTVVFQSCVPIDRQAFIDIYNLCL
ncbi:MAG: iron-containing alcohol dehydrogenase [Clostridiales bacterium]|nr:iron-containing alcohol dehydrogenase [Clostridiales bacterium]